jgi:hypothetical protein
MDTGPIPPQLTLDLEALKQSLAAMRVDDISENDAQRLAAEIGAIRLHLKRLAFERADLERRLARSPGL